MQPQVKAFFDDSTFTVSYVVVDPISKRCAVIDSVLEYDPRSGRTDTAPADRVIDFVRSNELAADWILETHAHADHLGATPYFKIPLHVL